jgi:hypothetical protein
MGYYSDVAVTLTGEAQEVKDLLNAYRLTESAEQIEEAWHLLADVGEGWAGDVKFFYEEIIDGNEPVAQLTWLFSGVKWYDASTNALARLGELMDDMQEDDKYSTLSLVTTRMGENPDDFDEDHWGQNAFDYESPINVIRHFEVQAPAVEVNPIKQLFQIEGK